MAVVKRLRDAMRAALAPAPDPRTPEQLLLDRCAELLQQVRTAAGEAERAGELLGGRAQQLATLADECYTEAGRVLGAGDEASARSALLRRQGALQQAVAVRESAERRAEELRSLREAEQGILAHMDVLALRHENSVARVSS